MYFCSTKKEHNDTMLVYQKDYTDFMDPWESPCGIIDYGC